MPEETRFTGPLRPIELATASVLAGVTVALTVIGWFLPHLGPVAALSVVPLGVVSHRHRLRALMASAFAASILSFLVAGTGTVSNVVACAVVGGLVGTSLRRGWPFGLVFAIAGVVAPILAGVSIGLLAVFSTIRKLTLSQIHNTWKGLYRVFGNVPVVGNGFHWANHYVAAALRDWWITVGIVVIVSILWFTVLAWVLLGPVLERLKWVRAGDRLDPPEPDPAHDHGHDPAHGPAHDHGHGHDHGDGHGHRAPASAPTPAPVPVELRDVHFRYPGAESDALDGVTLDVEPGEFVALVGDNGSGKSTLARLLAGKAPTQGTVSRAGAAGLGAACGTSMIMQHPETQILGVRVADDVVWGLHDASGVDVAGLLRAVGLEGMERRETSTLSGGELQRLAVAAALARHPRLLISDESTAMVDQPGRRRLTALLAGLPAERGMTVVHVTHRDEETAGADKTFRLSAGRLVTDDERELARREAPAPREVGAATPGAAAPAGATPRGATPRLELRTVSHTYGAGSPWAHRALEGVDLVVEPGDGMLVVGGNGSGKTTLAWILAGVLQPSRGSCLLGGEPVRAQVGAVGLAFQHARLQLQRSTVGKDVRAAGAADDEAVACALRDVGLDPDVFAERSIDELSGGQQRRVALAGILARRPSVLVLDEPLAGLDSPSQESLVDLLAGLRYDQGLSVVVISHDLEGMERVCERLVRLDAGRIVFDGAREGAQC